VEGAHHLDMVTWSVTLESWTCPESVQNICDVRCQHMKKNVILVCLGSTGCKYVLPGPTLS